MGNLVSLSIVCQKRLPILPTEGLPGIDSASLLPAAAWRYLLASLSEDNVTPLEILDLQGRIDNPQVDVAVLPLAQAVADATCGFVLRYMPVTSPPRFELVHRGQTSLELTTWEQIIARSHHYRDSALASLAAKKAALTEALANWQPDPDADDWSDVLT